jgi:hypothetical protein
MSLLGFLLREAKDKAEEYQAKSDLEEKLGRKVSKHEIYSLGANLESAAAPTAQTYQDSSPPLAAEPKSRARKFMIFGVIAFLIVSAAAVVIVMDMSDYQYYRLNPFTPKPSAETIPKAAAGYGIKEEPTYYDSYLSKECNCNAFKAEYYLGGKVFDKNHITYTLYNFKSADEAKKHFTDKHSPGKNIDPLQKSDSRYAVIAQNTGGLAVYQTIGQHIVLLSGNRVSDVIAFENNLPYAAFGVEKPPAQSADAYKEQAVSVNTLLEEFNRDKVAAQNKYHGRFIKLTGVVSGSGETKNGEPFLAFQLPNAKSPVGSTLACSFSTTERINAAKVKNGETVQFRGKVNVKNSLLNTPTVEECIFDQNQ